MPLEPRTVELPAIGSVDERTDPKHVRAPSLAKLQNVDLSAPPAMRQRRPFEQHSNPSIVNPSIPPREQGVPDINNLVAHSRSIAAASSQNPFRMATMPPIRAGRHIFVAGTEYQTSTSREVWSVYSMDPDVGKWERRLTLFDASHLQLLAGISGEGVTVVYRDATSGDIRARVGFSNLGGFYTAVTLVSATEDEPVRVAQKDELEAWFACRRAGRIECYTLDPSLISPTASLVSWWTATPSAYDIAYVRGSDFVLGAFYPWVGTNTAFWDVEADNISTQLAGIALESLCVGETIAAGGADAKLMYAEIDTAPDHRVHEVSFDTATILGAITISSPFPVTHQAIDSQPAVVDGQPITITRWAPQDPLGGTRGISGTRVVSHGQSLQIQLLKTALLSPLEAPLLTAESVKHTSPICVDLYSPDGGAFWAGECLQDPRTFGAAAPFTGSAEQTNLSVYHLRPSKPYHPKLLVASGVDIVPCQPARYGNSGPVIKSIQGVPTGSIPLGTYEWVAVFEAFDDAGGRWQSTPSLPFSYTLSGSDAGVAIFLYAPAVPSVGLRTALYRRGATGNFQRVTPYTVSGMNPLATLLLEGDSTSPADAAENELLYTTGGVVEDSGWPPSSSMAVHRGRLFAAHSETGDIWGSKPFRGAESVRFSADLTIQNPYKYEAGAALVSGSSALYVLYRTRIGMIHGDGPNDLGQGGAWSDIEFLPGDQYGTISPRCVATTSDGIYFIDERRGACFLAFGQSPIALSGFSAEESYPTSDWAGVEWLEDRGEVRFVRRNGEYRAYHVTLQAWSTGTLPDSDIAQTGVWGVDQVYMRDDGSIYREVISGSHRARAATTYETGWLPLAKFPSMHARFKLWAVRLIGTSRTAGANPVTIEILRDFDDASIASTHTVDLSTLAADGELFQLRIRPSFQTAQAIKIRVSSGNAAGTSYDLSELGIEFGVPPGRGGRPRVSQGGMI